MRVCLYGARRRLRFLFVAIWMAGCAVARPHVPRGASTKTFSRSSSRQSCPRRHGIVGTVEPASRSVTYALRTKRSLHAAAALGRNVSYVEIQRNVPAGPHGTSLLELCNGALRWGLNCRLQV